MLAFLNVSPRNKTTCFLPLCHIDDFEISNLGLSQNSGERLEVVFFRHQGAEPKALVGELFALLNHGRDELYLATRTPKFGVLTAEIELCRSALAKVAPLALRAFIGFFDGGMEGRVAQGDVKRILRRDYPAKDILAHVLLSEGDLQLVEFANLPGRRDRGGVNIGAGKVPAVFALAGERVDQARSCADVQRLDTGPARDFVIVAAGQQIREIVDIVDTTGDRWAKIICRDIPEIDSVMRLEQGPIKHTNRGCVLKINSRLTDRVRDREWLKLG